MALHHQLPIYKQAYALLDLSIEVTRHIPRDFKRILGEKVREECIEIMTLIFRANVSRNKVPHIEKMLEHLQVVELLLRVLKDKQFINVQKYAKAIELSGAIGRQATGWKRASATPPAV